MWVKNTRLYENFIKALQKVFIYKKQKYFYYHGIIES